MHPDLESLLVLQERDAALTGARAALAKLDAEQAVLDAELAVHERALEEARRAASGAAARRSELESRIAGYRAMQERRRQQLEFVRGAKEASTLMAELDLARSVLVREETEFLRSGDSVTEAELKAEELARAHEAAQLGQEEQRAALAVRRAECLTTIEASEKERSAAAQRVRKPLLARYDRIRRGRAPEALYPLRQDSCGHCFTAVPLQRRAVIQQGQTIEACEVCGVMLYAEP